MESSRFLLRTSAKDLRRYLRDPVALLIWVGIPVAIALLLSLVAGGGGGGGGPTVHVLVADRDSSFLSQLVTRAGGRGGLVGGSDGGGGGRLVLEEVTEAEGRQRMDGGGASALLIIPDGFADAVVEGTPAELTLITNPAQRIMPAVVREGLEVLVEAAFYVQRLFGEPLRRIASISETGDDEFPTDALVAGIATQINSRLRGVDGVLLPPILELNTRVEAEESEFAGMNYGTLFLPGILFMSVLFITWGISGEMWEEKERGTLRRALTAPHHASLFLGGKVLAGAVVCAGVAVVALAVVVGLFGVEVRRTPLALLWSTYAGAVLLVYFILLQLLGTSRRGANVLSTLVVFPLMMVGGSFFPFAAMPDWLAAVGRWTPNGLAVTQLQHMLLGQVETASLLGSAAGIGIPAVAVFLVAVWRLRTGFAVS